jgi:hypothetical protein
MIRYQKDVRDLTGLIDRDECQWIGGGGFGDVYRGVWKNRPLDVVHEDVVIKVIRSTGTIDLKTTDKRLKVELHMCSLR